MVMSSEQQELIDLLRNELAEIIGANYAPLGGADTHARHGLLEELEAQAENIGNAARLVGLLGLADCCDQLAKNFVALAGEPSALSGERLALVQGWAVPLLGYLQYFGQGTAEAAAIDRLIQFLAGSAWPMPMGCSEVEQAQQNFEQSSVAIEDNRLDYPEYITPEMASLAIPEDVPAELHQGLLMELPGQVEAFDRAVEQYRITEDLVQLRIAQRVAHTVKGAANVVGVHGMANLMHYIEDLLEYPDRLKAESKVHVVLQQSADCMFEVCDFLLGHGPPPNNLQEIIQAVVAVVVQIKASPHSGSVEEVALDSSTRMDAPSAAILPFSPPGDMSRAQADRLVHSLEDEVFEQAFTHHNQGVDDGHETMPWTAQDKQTSEQAYSRPEESIPLLDDIYHRPIRNPSEPSALPSLSALYESPLVAVQVVPGVSKTEGAAFDEEPEPAVTPTKVDVIQSAEAVVRLGVSEAQAEELLRLSGEAQIGNAQLLTRIGAVASGVQAAERYQAQMRQMASQLDQLVELQAGLQSATGMLSHDEIDPLELERYNELNSFASQLHELTTDAFEAIAHVSGDLKDLKNAVLNQRQLGFESQQLLMRVRMLPVSLYTARFTRCVRQASRLIGKPAQLQIKGEGVLVDTRVLNALVDPIMHLLRNAVDHGLESTEAERTAAGKSSVGNITLTFQREGESVVISCRDDGQGLDYPAIERSAREHGLTDEPELDAAQLHALILSSGFSTRKTVTQTSGRGVGLDVVNAQVKQLKAVLSIDSDAGQGSCFTINAPMSILSAHTLVVQVGQHSFSVVSRSLEQVVYLERERLVEQEQKQYYRLIEDEDLLPLFALDEIAEIPVDGKAKNYRALIVTRSQQGTRCGVLVESVTASEEQIIKPLSRYAYKVPGVIGATVLGDGRVSPVIDLHELPGLSMTDGAFVEWQQRFAKRLTDLQSIDQLERPMALVVDDSLSARRSLAQFVGDMGMEVYTAKDGFEAIQIIEQRTPNLILADLEMPRMNGIELTHHLRANKATRHIPVIMITSRATEKHKGMAKKVGVNAYLNKPWTDDELLSSIQGQLEMASSD